MRKLIGTKVTICTDNCTPGMIPHSLGIGSGKLKTKISGLPWSFHFAY